MANIFLFVSVSMKISHIASTKSAQEREVVEKSFGSGFLLAEVKEMINLVHLIAIILRSICFGTQRSGVVILREFLNMRLRNSTL
jgi:hypothetical protein